MSSLGSCGCDLWVVNDFCVMNERELSSVRHGGTGGCAILVSLAFALGPVIGVQGRIERINILMNFSK